MATNSGVQQAGGRAVGYAATNKTVQQQAGHAVCSSFFLSSFLFLFFFFFLWYWYLFLLLLQVADQAQNEKNQSSFVSSFKGKFGK